MAQQFKVTLLIEESNLEELKGFVRKHEGTILEKDEYYGKAGRPPRIDTKTFVNEYIRYIVGEITFKELERNTGFEKSTIYGKTKKLGMWSKKEYLKQHEANSQYAEQVLQEYIAKYIGQGNSQGNFHYNQPITETDLVSESSTSFEIESSLEISNDFGTSDNNWGTSEFEGSNAFEISSDVQTDAGFEFNKEDYIELEIEEEAINKENVEFEIENDIF